MVFLMKPAKHDIRGLKGILPKLKRTVTIDEMTRRWAADLFGLDTHILVRYLAQDDPRHAASATRVIEGR